MAETQPRVPNSCSSFTSSGHELHLGKRGRESGGVLGAGAGVPGQECLSSIDELALGKVTEERHSLGALCDSKPTTPAAVVGTLSTCSFVQLRGKGSRFQQPVTMSGPGLTKLTRLVLWMTCLICSRVAQSRTAGGHLAWVVRWMAWEGTASLCSGMILVNGNWKASILSFPSHSC